MKYFNNCSTLEEVKALYRQLAKLHHPDKGGCLQTMQAINAEYAYAIRYTANKQQQTANETGKDFDLEAEILNAEAYQQAINAIINLEGIEIEICGGWIWVHGNTYQHRAIFKSNGFYFASKKVAWYFRSVEYKTANHKTMSMPDIRNKYGSHKITSSSYKYLAL